MTEDGYDVHLFIEIILSEGATLLNHHEIDGVKIEYYQGRNGKRVPICIDDEYFPKELVIAHLQQLGMDDLISRLYVD